MNNNSIISKLLFQIKLRNGIIDKLNTKALTHDSKINIVK